MTVVSLASGSGGNACCVTAATGETLLVDCGISCRCLESRCRGCGIDPGSIVAAIFTHDHVDHVRGAPLFAKRHPSAALYANWMTAEAAQCAFARERQPADAPEFTLFENGQRFAAGPFSIVPFSIPHDVPDPVGFMIEVDGLSYFHATDVGTPLASIGAHLACADVATLEFNHDPELLARSARPECLKRRIRGGRGHLSNDKAAELVREYAGKRLRALALAHLSEECNAPHLALSAAEEALSAAGLSAVSPVALSQTSAVRVF